VGSALVGLVRCHLRHHLLFASNLTLILLTAVLVAAEWWYRRLRWPFPAMLAYYLVMLGTTDPVGSAPWFQSATFWFANL